MQLIFLLLKMLIWHSFWYTYPHMLHENVSFILSLRTMTKYILSVYLYIHPLVLYMFSYVRKSWHSSCFLVVMVFNTMSFDMGHKTHLARSGMGWGATFPMWKKQHTHIASCFSPRSSRIHWTFQASTVKTEQCLARYQGGTFPHSKVNNPPSVP